MPEPLVWYKDSEDELDFPLTWADWLPDLDTIVESNWVVPPEIEMINSGLLSPVTVIWLAGGGVTGTRHILQNEIVTALGRRTERTITVIMRDR